MVLKTSRSKRAIWIALLVGILLMIPVGYRAWLDVSAGGTLELGMGQVKSFLVVDVLGKQITQESIRGTLTVVLNVPSICLNNQESQTNIACLGVIQSSDEIVNWVDTNLKIKYSEDKNPLSLLATSGGYIPKDLSWTNIPESPKEGHLVPNGFGADMPSVTVIDPWLNFVYSWRLGQDFKVEELKRVLSRSVMDQYLGTYLAKRTFMGPKRDPK